MKAAAGYMPLLASISLASSACPPLTARDSCPSSTGQTASSTSSGRLGLEWIGSNCSLPKILVLYTGGTIVGGSTYGGLDDTQYGQMAITAEELIGRNPLLLDVAQLAVSNWTTQTGDSTGTSDALVMNMTRYAHDALCADDSDIDGAVFTHGTDSLEETAFVMDLLINCHKPVVAAGAMRPWTALSYDGDANFFQSVSLAASAESRDRGGLVAFSNRILQSFWVTKMTPSFPDGFGVTAVGDVGAFLNNMPYFYGTPSTPTPKHQFDLTSVNEHSSFPGLPKVDILYTQREFDGGSVPDAVKRGAKGLVIAGTGSGSVPNGYDEVEDAWDQGLHIVVGTRSPFGAATPERQPKWAKAGYVHINQARIMLQLAIASNFSQQQTIDLFEGSLRRAIGQPLDSERKR